MTQLPLSISKRISRYENIEINGLILHPILVKNYEEFLMARTALEVMHQSLPVALMRVPLLAAFYQLDYDARRNGAPPVGLFARALLALALALRLGEGQDPEERLQAFKVVTDRENPTRLSKLLFLDGDGNMREIDPARFKELREIIAAQNGVRLEADTANPDIVQMKKDMNAGGANLDVNIDTLRSFAAAMERVDETEIDEWPILKLTRRTEAYQTMLSYLVCGIGEASGATWKTGNPYPHPIFRRVDDGAGLASAFGGAGASAEIKNKAQAIEAQITNSQ